MSQAKEEELNAEEGKVDLDSILIKELGQFGKFQLKTIVLCVIPSIFCAFATGEYLFTAARINTRCLIPECDAATPEFWAPWIHNAIPGSAGSLDNCKRYAGNSSLTPQDRTCPATLFDQSSVVNCEEYVYENTNTIVYDFGLACDEWRRTLIGSIRTLGMFVALPLTGYISDRWGRRMAIIFAGFNGAWIGAMRYFVDSYIAFIILHLIEAAVSFGIYTSAYILLLEMFGTKYRSTAAIIMQTFWAIGSMILGFIAWGIPNWRNLTLTIFVPQLMFITYFWIATESARWYMSKGRFTESEAVLQKIAKTNGKTLSPKSLDKLKRLAEKERFEKEQVANEPLLIIQVFKHKKILLRCLIAPVWWITSIFIYYGISINAVNMTVNPHLNYVAVSAAEIPGLWISVFLIDRIGRKPLLIGSFWSCAACQLAFIFIPNDYFGLSLTFYLLGKTSITVVVSAMYVYTAELYPTKHRNSLFAFTSMVGRIGSMVAPLTPAIGAYTFEEFPSVLFCSLALLSSILIFLTPETLGTKLPDTMEEAENLQQIQTSQTTL